MKRFISVFLISVFAVSVYGQTDTEFRRNEIDASYGVVTTNQLLNVFKDVVSVIFSFGNYDKTNTDYTGGWFVDYKFAPTKNLLLDAGIGFDGARGDLVDDDVVYGNYTSSYTTAALGFDYRYLNKDWVQLYSGLGAGLTFSKDKGTEFDTNQTEVTSYSPYFNLQFNLLGVRVGKSLAGFAEFGFGYKGLVNAGISYSF